MMSFWKNSPSILLWEIWKEGNKRIFANKEMPISSFLNKVEASIIEVINNHFRNIIKEEGDVFGLGCRNVEKMD